MSEQQPQVSKMAGALVEHQRAFEVMPVGDRQWVITNTVAAIVLFAEAVRNRPISAVAEAKKLLKFLFSFNARAVKKFVVKEKFVEGKTVDGVSIAWLGSNFKKNHLGKVEEDVPEIELKVHELLTAARDLPKDDEPGIISELAGRQETTHAHFFQLLAYKQQTKDFTWAIGYIADENGVLWAVGAYWSAGDDGWFVEAYSVESPGRWSAGSQVVSR